jgi:acyl-homoserine lactone acylase PvdQ
MKTKHGRTAFWLFTAILLITLLQAITLGQDRSPSRRGGRVQRGNGAQMARQVTIYRDTYGVPHVFGRTDASTVFGFAYAQAEDNFWRVEENFISALGRLSEVYGEDQLNEDRRNHALEIPRLAREE